MWRLTALAVAGAIDEEGMSLLQTNVHKNTEEQMEHEFFTSDSSSTGTYGCQSTLHADSISKCSFWGEPHISKSFVSEVDGLVGLWGVFDRIGLYRLAWAKDKSWEIQTYSCGIVMGAIAIRMGNTTIEFVNNHPSVADYTIYIDGVVVPPDGPWSFDDATYFGKTSVIRKILRGRKHNWGYCIDAPNGDFQVEISNAQHPWSTVGNMMQMYMEVDRTKIPVGKAEDPQSLCNRGNTGRWENRGRIDRGFDLVNPDIVQLDISASIFSPERDVCSACQFNNVGRVQTHASDAHGMEQCKKLAPTPPPTPSPEEACQQHGVEMAQARDACKHLLGKDGFYGDCIFDCCMSNPETCKAAANNAENEENEENPELKCITNPGECDPDDTCDNSVAVDMSNVLSNNLDGSSDGPAEMRFGGVITKASGEKIDLVVTAIPEYSSLKGNSANGAQGKLANVNIDCGSTTKFKFSFVNQATGAKVVPVEPGEKLVFSFLDLDQGRRGKGKSSVKICGAEDALLSTNTELESTVGECVSVSSTVRGTAKDNPTDPDDLSDLQRARTASFVLGQQTDFTAQLSVATCNGGRNFAFTGSPGAACGK